jgi:hypothetical protein
MVNKDDRPQVHISGPGILTVTSEELLKSARIRAQYRKLRDPRVREALFKR